MPEVQKLSNSKIAFVNDEGVFKNNIVVVGPRMIGDPGTFRFCFYIIYVSFSLKGMICLFPQYGSINSNYSSSALSQRGGNKLVITNSYLSEMSFVCSPHLPMGGPLGGGVRGVGRRDG